MIIADFALQPVLEDWTTLVLSLSLSAAGLIAYHACPGTPSNHHSITPCTDKVLGCRMPDATQCWLKKELPVCTADIHSDSDGQSD